MPNNDDWSGAEEYRPEVEGKGSRPQVHVNKVADAIMAERRFVQPASGVVYEYVARRGYWVERSDDYLLALAKRADAHTRQARRNEIKSYIAASVHDSDHEFGRCAPHEIAFVDGVVDVLTGKVRAHRPEDFLDSVIPHRYDPAAKAERWEEVLIEWFGDAESGAEKIAALQEFTGYVCLPGARYKRALVCYGESNTGKSRVIMALKALAGAEWTCSIGVEHMDDPVKMVAIEHMRLNVITELSADAMIRDGGFKTLVGTQEPIFLNPKYQRPRMYVPLAKHAIACNSLPDVNDRTMATFNRLLLIPFSNVIEKHHQDPALDDKLGAEIEGIFAWAVEGAKRLIENRGQFTEVGEAKELIANYRAEANPIVGFMDEEMVKEADAVAPLIDIVKCFNEKRYGRPVDARRVSKWLRAHLGEGCVRPARIGEKTARCLIGWRLRGDFRSE